MRLDFLMLADGANAADGKLYIHGGAITRATVPALPAHLVMTAVARFLADPAEVGGPSQAVSFEWVIPEGKVVPLLQGEVSPTEPAYGIREGEDIGIVFVANMVVELTAVGSHALKVLLGEDEVCTRRLYIEIGDAPQSRPSAPQG